jgi:hypothetical protein
LYPKQAAGTFWRTPEELFQAVDLWNLTQQTADHYFASLGVSSKFVHEFIDGTQHTTSLQFWIAQ